MTHQQGPDKFISNGNKFHLITVFLFALFVTSCVGTVEDKNPKTSKGAGTETIPPNFDGISEAVPISDTKIDILFYPSSGSPTETTYVITYDGNDLPITVPGTALRTDYRGLLKYTVDGLAANRTYSFNVQAKDQAGNVSASDQIRIASTFANRTANFFGITNLRNLSGQDGRNALRVEWSAAEREGSVTLPKEIDPIQYEIILIDADAVTPAAFDDPAFLEPTRKVVIVDGSKISHQVNGLQSGTRYFVRVRAIHQGFSDNSADINYKREQNSNYLELATLSDDAADINVDLSAVSIGPSDGSDGLTSFDASWDAAKGAISHYRILYRVIPEDGITAGAAWSGYKNAKDANCNGQETNNPEWYCKRAEFNQTSTVLPDLKPLTKYEAYILVCLEADCSRFLEYITSPPYTTDPGVAQFTGITSLEGPRNYWALDKIYLNVTPPDLSTGNIDGLVVRLESGSQAGNDNPVFLNSPDGGNSTALEVESFDFATANQIVIRGADTQVVDGYVGYCFTVLPYYFNGGVAEVSAESLEITRCYPQDQPEGTSSFTPSATEFEGLNLDSTSVDTLTDTVTLAWETPGGGIYDQFVVYIKDVSGGGTFSFSDAVSGDSSYIKVVVPYGENGYSFPFLPSGGEFVFGVLTEYSAGTGSSRFSEFNTSTYSYSVP